VGPIGELNVIELVDPSVRTRIPVEGSALPSGLSWRHK